MIRTVLCTFALVAVTVVGTSLQVGSSQSPDNTATDLSGGDEVMNELKREGSFDSLAAAMTAAQYNISRTDDELRADNPANQIKAIFAESGDLQLSGAGQSSRWRTSWRLRSIGRGDTQTEVAEGVWQTRGSRAELQRSEAGILEYFENQPAGLEQGFVVDQKPNPDDATALRLVLESGAGVTAAAAGDGQSIVLSDAAGAEVLRYEKLKVWDAENEVLPASMTTGETGEINIDVDDADALYPLTIDPVFVQTQKLTADDGGGEDLLGSSVAISGDTVVVGAPGDDVEQGAAYIFVRSGRVWAQQAKLVASDGNDRDNFGRSVAISGDTVVIGAYLDNSFDEDEGSAYVFARNGVVWSPQEKLVAADGETEFQFGSSVAISNETIVVGAKKDTTLVTAPPGAAYVFVRNGGAWAQQAKLTAMFGTARNAFGSSVAITGDLIVVGSVLDAVGQNPNQGSAYIFIRNGSNWTQQTRLVASDGATGDEFGSSVDVVNTLSGPIVVVGAQSDNGAGTSSQGSAYVFSRSQIGTWSQIQKLTAADGSEHESFGSSVSIRSVTGSMIAVGAYLADGGRGAAYVFGRVDSVWTQQQKLTSANSSPNYDFGRSLAFGGDTLIVGMPFHNIGQNEHQGSASIFDLGSRAFDFDGDGRADMSVFRPSSGAWYLNRSTAGSFGTQFGNATDKIAPADYDGDGKTDVAVYRPAEGRWYIGNSSNGTVSYYIFGLADDLPAPADYDGDGRADICVFRPSTGTWYRQNSSNGSFFGIQFGSNGDRPTVGDFDGDSKADIGIWRPSNGDWYHIRSSDGTVFGERFGISTDKMVPADYDGDGRTDLAVWRPSSGIWYIKNSLTSTYTSFAFGLSTDIPAPADFDGDGKADRTVFRPSNGTWYITNTAVASFTIFPWGQSGDRPTPNAFLN